MTSTDKAQGRAGKSGIALRLFRNYVIDRLMGKPSTAGFWWRREIARVRDEASFRIYRNDSDPSPLYLMNYESKLAYQHRNPDGIIVLPYSQPIGDRINPEAAFIYALAVHDNYRKTGSARRREEFLHYARYFRERQSGEGDWFYDFDWPGSPAPWTSALAQGRGASVMLRAFRLTAAGGYADAARAALSRFDQDIANDGYRALHPLVGLAYYEEYPKRPIGVMNGFMASLLGCWEVGYWLQDETATRLFEEGIATLREMTPHYMVEGWSVYDRNPDVARPNFNTPRYHRLVGSYFEILAVLSGDEVIARQRDEWLACLGLFNESKALARKFAWKLNHGVFSS